MVSSSALRGSSALHKVVLPEQCVVDDLLRVLGNVNGNATHVDNQLFVHQCVQSLEQCLSTSLYSFHGLHGVDMPYKLVLFHGLCRTAVQLVTYTTREQVVQHIGCALEGISCLLPWPACSRYTCPAHH